MMRWLEWLEQQTTLPDFADLNAVDRMDLAEKILQVASAFNCGSCVPSQYRKHLPKLTDAECRELAKTTPFAFSSIRVAFPRLIEREENFTKSIFKTGRSKMMHWREWWKQRKLKRVIEFSSTIISLGVATDEAAAGLAEMGRAASKTLPIETKGR